MAEAQSWDETGEAENFVDELKPGTKLMHGQYTIDSFLNAGGFGITYLARDSLDRKIVIKECFPGAFCRRSTYLVQARSRAHENELRSIVRLFVQEARNLAKLDHPNIVGVHQVFEDNDTAYMALDFVEGRDLLDTIEDPNHGLTAPQIKVILKEVLGAVGFIHDQGILHRDISPDNILIDKDLHPVLIDFGAAREEATKQSRVLSALRVVKDGYSPQEFYIAGSDQSPSSDLYALAASFYHLISDDVPPNSQARLAAIASGEADPYQPLVGRFADYEEPFLAALDKALAVLPKDRLQSARDWVAMIDGAQGNVTPLNTAASAAATAPAAATEAAQKSKMPLLLGSAAVIALLVGVGIFVTNSGGDSAETELAAPATTTATPAPAAVTAPTQTDLAATADAISDEGALPAPTTELAGADSTLTEAEVMSLLTATPDAPAASDVATTATETAPEVVSEVTEGVAAELAPEAATTEDALSDVLASVVAETAAEAETIALPEALATPTPSPEVTDEPTVAGVAAPLPVAVPTVADTPTASLRPTARPPSVTASALPDPVPLPVTQDTPDVTSASLPLLAAGLVSPAIVAADSSAPLALPSLPAVPDTVSAVGGGRELQISALIPGNELPPVLTPAEAAGITEDWTVQLPFVAAGARSNIIAEVGPVAPVWVRQGLVITGVNGMPVEAIADIPAVLKSQISADALDTTLPVLFETLDPASGERESAAWVLPVVQELTLANGARFNTVFGAAGWRTTVADLPADAAGDLQVGDVLASYIPTGESIDGRSTLRSLVVREAEAGTTQYMFAVQRDGSLWVASLRYDGVAE